MVKVTSALQGALNQTYHESANYVTFYSTYLADVILQEYLFHATIHHTTFPRAKQFSAFVHFLWLNIDGIPIYSDICEQAYVFVT